jgi:hypothetical protein
MRQETQRDLQRRKPKINALQLAMQHTMQGQGLIMPLTTNQFLVTRKTGARGRGNHRQYSCIISRVEIFWKPSDVMAVQTSTPYRARRQRLEQLRQQSFAQYPSLVQDPNLSQHQRQHLHARCSEVERRWVVEVAGRVAQQHRRSMEDGRGQLQGSWSGS